MLRDVLPVFVATRLLFIALTLLTPLWRTLTGTSPLLFVRSTGTVLDSWNRWDTRWYDGIALLGYNIRGPDGFKNVAFFPLFPLLTRTLHDGIADIVRDVFGMALPDKFWPPYLVPAMIVANVCALLGLAFLYALVRLDHGRPVAQRTVTLLALCPPAMFLFAAYSEGPYLLCVVAFFYTLRLQRWWQAGFWGLLTTAARPPGVVLIVPFIMAWADAHPAAVRSLTTQFHRAMRALLDAIHQMRRHERSPQPAPAAVRLDLYQRRTAGSLVHRRPDDGAVLVRGPWQLARGMRRDWRDWPEEVRQAVRHVAPVAAIPLGLILFMGFLWRVLGNPLWFSAVQSAWMRTFAPPWETLYLSVAWPLGDFLHHTLTVVDFYALHDLCYEIAGLTLTILAWRYVPRVQSVYMWLVWLTLLSSPAMLVSPQTDQPHHDVLMSLPRMTLMLFPLFIFLGLQRRLYRPLVIFFITGLVFYTETFLTGGWLS